LNLDKWTSGSAYDQWMGRWSRLLADEFLKWLCVSSGARWLDVCCGSGVVTEAIAEFCSPASIVGIDASAAQIAFARMHRTHSGITFELSDATAVPFPDASFDAAVCGLGLNYISEPARALQEMQRVTRSGGTIAAYVWDYAQGVRFLREFWDAAIAVDPEARAFDQGRRFPMCSLDGLRTLFQVIEVKEVKLSALQVVTRFASFDEYWAPLLSGQGSAPNYLASRDAQIRAAVRNRLQAFLPTDAQGSIEMPARAWAIRARRA
jgi:SAM-dependent methyltransferase